MSLDINSSNVSKVNSLIQRVGGLNITDASKAGYVDNLKKADADGNGRISQDEYKRYAKDVLTSTVDLSAFGDMDVVLGDFDAALGDWFASVDALDSAEGIGLTSNPNLPADAGKTRADLAAEKIARGEELNFGHKTVDGELWKMKDGSPVWADTGTRIEREQLAAMPDYQVAKFYQMMGLGYDPKAEWRTDSHRQLQADSVRYYTPGTPQEGIFQSRRNAVVDLDNIQMKLNDRVKLLEGQKEGADDATSKQIDAQIAQLVRTLATVSAMRLDIEAFKIPAKLTNEEGGRLNAAMTKVAQLVREVPGMDSMGLAEGQVRFTQLMNQVRNPGLDVEKDPLFANQFNAMVNASNVQGRVLDRLDQLVRQSVDADARTKPQIDAQMAQLRNTYDGITEILSRLTALRPAPTLSQAERKGQADILHGLDLQLRQLAGADREQFDKLLGEMRKGFDKL